MSRRIRPIKSTTVLLTAAALGLTSLMHALQPAVPPERTLVGCVENAKENAPDLLLTHAKFEEARAKAGAGNAAAGQATYRLTGVAAVQLARLVGRTVRVVGFIEKEPPRTGGPIPPPDSGDERRGGTARPSVADAPTFRARTAQSLASTCEDK